MAPLIPSLLQVDLLDSSHPRVLFCSELPQKCPSGLGSLSCHPLMEGRVFSDMTERVRGWRELEGGETAGPTLVNHSEPVSPAVQESGVRGGSI